MNKLEEYKLSLHKDINSFDHESKFAANIFNKGFDVAIALELPVLFATWSKSSMPNSKGKDVIRRALMNGSTKEQAERELYKYWIENIYEK